MFKTFGVTARLSCLRCAVRVPLSKKRLPANTLLGKFIPFLFFTRFAAITLVVQRNVSGRVLDALCLASRHNAQQGISLIDLRGPSVGLHDGSIRRAHDLRHHLVEHKNWALHDLRQDLRHEVGDLFDEIWRVHRRLSSRLP